MLADLGKPLGEVMGDSRALSQSDPAQYTDERFGLPTVRDILRELEKPIADGAGTSAAGARTYRELLSAMKAGKYKLVLVKFNALQHRYPKSPLVETIPGIGTVSDQIKQRFTAVLGARVGYAYDTWLPYAFAGLDYTGLRVTTGPGSSFAKNYDHTYVGLAAGVGVEHALTRHVSLDLRYMYTHLPSRTFNFGGGPEKYSEPNGSTLTGGITYRF